MSGKTSITAEYTIGFVASSFSSEIVGEAAGLSLFSFIATGYDA